MNRQEMLLTHLSEECNEVGQRVSKALRFGLAEVQKDQSLTNAERIVEEYIDLMAIMAILYGEGVLPAVSEADFEARVLAKKAKVERYMEFSRGCGTLTD